MNDHIHKSHNKSLLLYHFVCPIKYRRKVLTDEVCGSLRKTCLEMEKVYEFHFLEIGLDGDHVHFLIQSVPKNSPRKKISAVKSITAKEMFRQHPEVKEMLFGGGFWTSGYYVAPVG